MLIQGIYHRSMRIAALTLVCCMVVTEAPAAILLVPANAQEILNVLGPDARGLRLRTDALPDLFTLTASRLDEDPKVFIVEEPYLSGRWRGGKAIIEYARDLSYTQVSIYDRQGNRQRIYAVRSKLEERELHPRVDAVVNVSPTGSGEAPSDKPRRRRHVEEEPPSAPPVEQPVAREEPQSEPAAPPATEPPAPSTHRTEVAMLPTPVPSPTPTPKLAKQTPPPSAAVAAPAAPADETDSDLTAGPHYEWDEEKGAYVSVNVKVVTPATPTQAARVETTRAPEPPSTAKVVAMPTPAQSSTAPAAASVPAASAVAKKSKSKHKPAELEPPVDLHPAPQSGDWAAIADTLAKNVVTKSPEDVPAGPVVALPPNVKASVVTPTAAPSTTRHGKGKKGTRGATGDVQAPPDQVVVQSEDAYDFPANEQGPAAATPKNKKMAKAKAAVAPSAPAAAPIPPELADAQKRFAASAPEEAPAAAPAQAAAVESANTEATGAEHPVNPSSDSDGWVPNNAAPAPANEVIPEPKAKTKKAKNNIDDLMKIASLNEGAVPDEANAWVPRKTVLPPPDADIHDELKRARQQKKVEVPVVKLNRDVNNPEEGVLPANSFEKFSGPHYGRHREYERRLYFSKKSNAPLTSKEYDFFVDEVDRKKEFHNVYYYVHEAKGHPPRLVAVEKHDRVTFMSNYDVDKENKGKVTKY